jgi:hypothetical protein
MRRPSQTYFPARRTSLKRATKIRLLVILGLAVLAAVAFGVYYARLLSGAVMIACGRTTFLSVWFTIQSKWSLIALRARFRRR